MIFVLNNGIWKRKLKNELTVTIENENKITEAKEFIRNWKCGKKEYTSKIEFVDVISDELIAEIFNE